MDRVPFLATTGAAPYERITQLPVSVMLENVRSIFNVGSFFRTCDAARQASREFVMTAKDQIQFFGGKHGAR